MNKNIYEMPMLTVVEYAKEDILFLSETEKFDNKIDDPFGPRE